MKNLVIVLTFVVINVSCSTNHISKKAYVREPDFVKISDVGEPKVKQYEGSLYSDGSLNMFGDAVAMRINDLVNIKINQQSSLSIKSGKNLSKTTSKTMAGGGLSTASNDGTISAIVKGFNDLTNFGFQGNSDSNFQGSGNKNRTDNLSTNISARIIKILKNDNYYIVGTRNTMIDNQVQILYIAGVIRARDIQSDNSIDSKYISDARILYLTDGDLADQNNLPWGFKVANQISPF